MVDRWFISDTHFGHANIITFKDSKGNRIRPFKSVEEHDETIINNWNSLVKPNDRVYHMGDVVINRKHLATIGKLNGHKVLIKGNHDIFPLRDYTPYFEDIRAYKVFPKHDLIVSHIPVHTGQLEGRFKWNAHGHLHINLVERKLFGVLKKVDRRYMNLCVEHTAWRPVNFDDLQFHMKGNVP